MAELTAWESGEDGGLDNSGDSALVDDITIPSGISYQQASMGGQARVMFGDQFIYVNDRHHRGDGKLSTLLQSLAFDGMGARLRNIPSPSPHTCEWLFQHLAFQSWANSGQTHQTNIGFLHILDNPGSGKSVIMKSAYKWIQKQSPKEIVIAYFFSARASTRELENSSYGMLRTIVHHLVNALPGANAAFLSKFEGKEMNGRVDEWHSHELQDFLFDLLDSPGMPGVTLFVDALDEGKHDDIQVTISILDHLYQHSITSQTSLRICLSSRHYPHIQFPNELSIILEQQDRHKQDVKMYIHNELRLMADDFARGRLKQDIYRKSAGCFLWAVLVVPAIKKAYHQGRINATERILETVPVALSDLFGEIITRDDRDLDSCISLFRWTLFSKRPLTPIEMCFAISYSGDMKEFDPENIPSSKEIQNVLLHQSRGLVEITKGSPPVVQFIHGTVSAFLLNDRSFTHPVPTLANTSQQHKGLKLSCLRYIRANAKAFTKLNSPSNVSRPISRYHTEAGAPIYEGSASIPEIEARLPFLNYATSCVFWHADNAEAGEISQENFIMTLVERNRSDFTTWVHMRNALQKFKTRWYSSDVSLLYTFTELGLKHLVQRLLGMQVQIDESGEEYEIAFQAACVAGHGEIVKILLNHGATINLLSRYGMAALHEAAKAGHEEVVQILIDNGANVNLQTSYGTTALYEAALGGHEKAMGLLLQTKASVNVLGGEMHTVLQAGSSNGKYSVVRWLLERGAQVNTVGGRYGTALQAAALRGSLDVVKLLVESGADVNAGGGEYGSALQAAAWIGFLSLVEFLIDQGANVNASGGFFDNPLLAAVFRGKRKVAQYLIRRGADVNAVGKNHGSALQAASARSDENMVQMLLGEGANNIVEQRTNDPNYELDSMLSTFMGSLDSTSNTEEAQSYLSRLFCQDPRLQPFYFTVVEFSTLGEQGLSHLLNRHFRILAHDLVNELHANKGSASREACKVLLFHTRWVAGEVARISHKREEQRVYESLRAQHNDFDNSIMTERFLDGLDESEQSSHAAYESTNRNEVNQVTTERVPEALSNGDGEEEDLEEVETSSEPESAISDQLDHQSLILEGFLKLFEQSSSFLKLIDNLWYSVQPDLFDWQSINRHWLEELNEPAPINLRYAEAKEIRFSSNRALELSDKIKLAFERFTGKPWDWWPFRQPKVPIEAGKVHLELDACCDRVQSFNVSLLLAEKVKMFVRVPAEARKDRVDCITGSETVSNANNPQGGDSSQAISLDRPSQLLRSPGALAPRQNNPSYSQTNRNPSKSSSTSVNCQQNQGYQKEKKFVLLCVRNTSGPDSLQHCQIEVPLNMADNDFFGEFRRQYRNLRGWFYWFHPTRFWFCHCSKFYKWDADKISWENHEMPKDGSYFYRPKPASEPYKLPVSRDEWEHRYQKNCSLLMKSDFLDRIPIRNKRFEIDTCISAHEVWRLYAEYRVSGRAVLAWSFICISPGVLFFVLWLVRFANDLQNASVPVMFTLSLVLLPIGLVTLGERFNEHQEA